MPWEEFRRYWPYADNFWSWNSGTNNADIYSSLDIVQNYRCRFHRQKDHELRSQGRVRNKPSRTAIGCPARMRLERVNGIVTVSRSAKCKERHNHDMAFADLCKWNSAVRGIARDEVEKATMSPLSLATCLSEKSGTIKRRWKQGQRILAS